MAWIFRSILWTSLVLSTSSNNYFGNGFPSYYDYPNYDDNAPTHPTSNYQRRLDHDYSVFEQGHGFNRQHNEYDRPINEQSRPRHHERPTQERSIPVNSRLQRIQEEERRRLDTKTTAPRNNNGSYKIVNIPRNYSVISNRRGQIQDEITSSDYDKIVFPGTSPKAGQQYIPEIPEECLKTNICEDVPNYPEELVERIIEKLDTARYKIDEMDTPEIAQRIGPPDEMELCSFKVEIVALRAAADKDGKWYYIINRKNKPLQGVLVELCNSDKAPCSNIVYYVGYNATCEQKYVQRHLTALDENGNIVDRLFRIPSCCSCVVR